MNIRKLANQFTSSTNPNQLVNWVQSTGYTLDGAGRAIPSVTSITIQAQIQALSSSDLQHTNNLNLQGIMRVMYLYGQAAGAIRAEQLGGDVFQFPELAGGQTRNWKVTTVMENWADWSKVIVTLQEN